MKAIVVSAGVFVFAMGCSAAEPTDSDVGSESRSAAARNDPTPNSSSSGNNSSSSSSSSSSSGAVTASACSELSGFWSGPIDGTYVDLLDPTNEAKRQPVLGTATVKIAAGADGKITMANESKLKLILKKILPGGGDATIDKPFTGGGTCQQLDGQSGGDTGLIKVDVKATCQFSQSTCPGTWTATSSGKPVAQGKFTLTKQQ